MLIIALNISGPNNLGPGNFIILPIKIPKYTITNKIIKLIRSKSIIGQIASLLNDPGNDIKINDGIVNTVKKILIICIIPTCLESAPHSSAPKTISRSPPGEAIKNASGFSIFLILCSTRNVKKNAKGIYKANNNSVKNHVSTLSRIDESKDPPNQTPSTPMNGFLNFGGIKTLTLNKAKIATKKAGPKTHGRGSNK